MINYHQEENNYPKAFAISTAIMAGFLALSFFIIASRATPPEEVGTGGIIVNYGTSDIGMGDDYMSVDEPSVAPNANQTAPDKVVTNPTPVPTPSSEVSDKSIVTQNAEDAPEIVTKKEKSTTTAPPTVSLPAKENKPAVNQNALYKGKQNDGVGKGDGTGDAPGNQGSKDGDPLAPNYGEGGSGFGSVSLTLANRKFVDIPRIEDQGQSSGKIAVEIRVDKNGEVVFARAGARGTTLSDLALWRKCESAVLGARLNRLESAPDVQVGVVMFNFKVK
ncbi:MAG TPA: energy transducer TonB [Daejeonella sp.]|nr:energy transducer TonB [Daejeonella sp.]